ncbi:MAG TPA: hypothetical protein VFR21_25965 [Bradyrhizobium sp.]|nr:hypothetical protein [Bradyrhizobium sp.]
MNKFVQPRPYVDPEAAARKLVEIAKDLGDVCDGRLFTEKLNGPMLTEFGASPAEYGAGIKRAVENGWLWAHESGTYYRLTRPTEIGWKRKRDEVGIRQSHQIRRRIHSRVIVFGTVHDWGYYRPSVPSYPNDLRLHHKRDRLDACFSSCGRCDGWFIARDYLFSVVVCTRMRLISKGR